jgi:cold shock CspA family protein
VKLPRNVALGYSNVADQFAGRKPDGNGDIAFHHALTGISNPQRLGGLLGQAQSLHSDVVGFEIIEGRELVLYLYCTCTDGKGPCGIDVRPLDEVVSNETEGSVLLGAVKSLERNYGFIKLDRGGDLFFHETHCTPTTKFRKLVSGERVRCTLEKGVDGRRRGKNVELYSGR